MGATANDKLLLLLPLTAVPHFPQTVLAILVTLGYVILDVVRVLLLRLLLLLLLGWDRLSAGNMIGRAIV